MALLRPTFDPATVPPCYPWQHTAHNLDVALALAAVGLPIFPCDHTLKSDGFARKTPCVPSDMDWHNVATTDTDQLRKWWRASPDRLPNRTGELSRYFRPAALYFPTVFLRKSFHLGVFFLTATTSSALNTGCIMGRCMNDLRSLVP